MNCQRCRKLETGDWVRHRSSGKIYMVVREERYDDGSGLVWILKDWAIIPQIRAAVTALPKENCNTRGYHLLNVESLVNYYLKLYSQISRYKINLEILQRKLDGMNGLNAHREVNP